MAPINRKWDAYLTLNITNRCDHGMDCVGTNRYGKRCRWDIPNDKYERVRAILDEIETHAPSEATASFERLAQFGLCQDWHQNQVYAKIREWTAAMQEVVEVYEESSLKKENQKLGELLEEEQIRAESLEQQTKTLRDEIKSLHATVVKQDSSLHQAKSELLIELEARIRAEKDVKRNTDLIQKMTIDHRVFEIRTNETINRLRQKKQKDSKTQDQLESSQRAFLEKHQKLQKLTALSQWQSKEMETMSADLEELDASETLLLAQKFDLTYELEVERHRIVTIESKLAEVTTDRDVALQEKADLQTQLDSVTADFDKLRQSLLDINIAQDKLREEKEDLELQVSTERQKSKNLESEIAQGVSSHTALVESIQTIAAELPAKQHTIDELRQALKAAEADLSNSQIQLRSTNEDLSRSREELANAKISVAKAQEEFEEGRRAATAREDQMLVRIEALMQQSGYSKKHPFRTFFVNLGGKVSRRMKSEAVATA